MVDFKKFLKSSNDISRLSKEIERINKPANNFQEEREKFWKPTLDKAGNAIVVLRFLPEPAVDGDDGVPWVRLFSHQFKNPANDKYYIQNSLTTLGQKDPCGEYNSKLWKAGNEAQARDQKRNTHYFANIQVIEEVNAPENNGKVFPYRFGPQVFRKIEEAIDPWHDEDGNEIPGTAHLKSVNPFHFLEGATFRLRVKTIKSGDKRFPNYTDSTFVKDQEGQIVTSKLSEDMKYLEDLWKSLPSVKQYISPDKFKSYDELKAKLYDVLGLDEDGEPVARIKSPTAVSSKKPRPSTIADDTVTTVDDEIPFDLDDDDENINVFKALANK